MAQLPSVGGISDSASTAAEALAARTAGALVKIGSDGKPADASVTAAQLAADSAKLANLGTGGFHDAIALIAAQYAAGTARVVDVPFSQIALTANIVDASLDGGGISPSSTPDWTSISRVLLATPKTSPWVLGFDIVMPAPQSGKSAYIGLREAGATRILIGHAYGNGGDATTKMLFTVVNGGSNATSYDWTPDGARHTIALAFDTVQLRLLVDGVVKRTVTDLAPMPTAAIGLQFYDAAGGSLIKLARAAIAVP